MYYLAFNLDITNREIQAKYQFFYSYLIIKLGD